MHGCFPSLSSLTRIYSIFLLKLSLDFFLSRYNEAYVTETIAFCESLVNNTPVPCTGEDGLVALVMALAADKSAEEGRWVSFREIIQQVYCISPTECNLLAQSELFPEGFKPVDQAEDLLLPDVDKQKAVGGLKEMARKLLSFAN